MRKSLFGDPGTVSTGFNMSLPGNKENVPQMSSDTVTNNITATVRQYETTKIQSSTLSAAEDSALQRNLSALSLERQASSSANSVTETSSSKEQVMLDKSFIAELEKDMYSNKGQNDYERNSSQMYTNKEVVFKQNLTPLKNSVADQSNQSSPSSNSGASPKMHNIERHTGQYNTLENRASLYRATTPDTVVSKTTNLENATAGSNNTQSVVNRIWYERLSHQTEYYAQPNLENIYSNQGIYQAIPVTTATATATASNINSATNHSFVAISNRVVPPKASNQMYASSASIYGSVTGHNMYDSVAPTPSTYYGQIPLSHLSNSNGQMYSNNNGSVNAPIQPVIYDEVALDDYLRPHRPAPLAPPQLSTQQIQRRLEKLKKQQESQGDKHSLLYAPPPSDYEREQQKIQQMIQDLGPNTQEIDVRNALRAASGDTTLAVRHYKIDQLSK